MAREYRQIVFLPKEVVRALIEYRKWRKDPLPDGKFTKFQMLTDPISVDFAVQPEGAAAAKDYSAQQDELASALILFCINAKVPIPAKSRKDVKYVGEQMALTITMDEHELV